MEHGRRVRTGFRVAGAPEHEVSVDSEEEQQTLLVAKGSRILGGNSGYFDGHTNSYVVFLDNVRCSGVWLSVRSSQLKQTCYGTSPAMADLKKAIGDD
eukprot:1001047-Pleurochrysis_carterae.AAC.1